MSASFRQYGNKKKNYSEIPTRKGTRPTTICGPLHIQRGEVEMPILRGLVGEVLVWPHDECALPRHTSTRGIWANQR
jgi:hypothetical protein